MEDPDNSPRGLEEADIADLSDVRDTLTALATTACYPNGTSSPSVTTRRITIAGGWPLPQDVDVAMSANQSIVTVYAVPGATAKEPPLYEPPQIITAPIIGMVAVASDDATSATITGTPSLGEYLTFIVDEIHAYSLAAGASDTNVTMAAALAALIAVDYPGTTAASGVVSIVGSHLLTVRIGAPYVTGQLIHRQRQQFRVTVFAPTDADRTAIGATIDVLFKQNIKLVFSDKSQGIMTYLNVIEDDKSEKLGNYRRGLVYDVSYGTMYIFTSYSITSVTVQDTDVITGLGVTRIH